MLRTLPLLTFEQSATTTPSDSDTSQMSYKIYWSDTHKNPESYYGHCSRQNATLNTLLVSPYAYNAIRYHRLPTLQENNASLHHNHTWFLLRSRWLWHSIVIFLFIWLKWHNFDSIPQNQGPHRLTHIHQQQLRLSANTTGPVVTIFSVDCLISSHQH